MTVVATTTPWISLKDEITREINSRASHQIRGLIVTLDGNTLTIAGRTTTYYLKQIAGHVAISYRGNRTYAIQNNIDVI